MSVEDTRPTHFMITNNFFNELMDLLIDIDVKYLAYGEDLGGQNHIQSMRVNDAIKRLKIVRRRELRKLEEQA